MIQLNTSNSFILISLESSTYNSGERITGTILLNTISHLSNMRLSITSTGHENILITSQSASSSSYSNEIFHASQNLASWDQFPPSQLIFPFSFKLPFYAPASFDLDCRDSSENCIKASIVYQITAQLTENESVIDSDQVSLNILSSEARNKPPVSRLDLPLSSCCCMKQGVSHITLNQSDEANPEYGQSVRFHLETNWEKNKGKIKEIKGSVKYKLKVSIPGGKTYEFYKEISDFQHSQSFLANNQKLTLFNEFEVMIDGNYGLNVGTNNTAIISSSYFAEAKIVFSFSFSEINQEIDLPIFVKPRQCPERQFEITGNWDPVPCDGSCIFLQNKTGQNIFSPSKSSFFYEKTSKYL